MQSKYPWKSYFRKFPAELASKIDSLKKGEGIIVYGVRRVNPEDVKKGLFEHIGLSWSPERERVKIKEVKFPRPIGRYSKRNSFPYEIVRKDLPMVTRTIEVEAPNWGDYLKGTHTVQWEKQRYARDLVPPKKYSFSLLNVGEESTYELRIDQIFKKEDKQELFFALNLMQEVFGTVDVRDSKDKPDYKKVSYVNWEIFPPGERENFIKRVLERLRGETDSSLKIMEERARFIASLKPKEYILGKCGLGERYFGAKIRENLVIFENRQYGNAVYILYEDWEVLSKLSRTELLTKKEGEFERIFHRGNWKRRVKRVLKK